MTEYRSDIDGLRALAVIPVILFHAGLPAFSGGFVGVDVFFVVSGYLITSILLAEHKAGTFSSIRFYNRRVRRLLPALFGVMIITTIVGYFLLLPTELKSFAKSLGATFAFSSNFIFWMESGYFDAAAETKPLLHTWSLAVEEQFYLLYPLLFVFLPKISTEKLRNILLTLILLSFLLSVYQSNHAPSAAYYLLGSRAWELLIGAVLACGVRVKLPHGPVNDLLGIAGLAGIIGAALFYDDSTRFPGTAALLPVLGSAMVINAGLNGPSIATRILTHRGLVTIGKTSYSLYLWHWPLIVFAGMYAGRPLGSGETALLLTLTLVVGLFSRKYIEQPFLRKKSTAPVAGRAESLPTKGLLTHFGSAKPILTAATISIAGITLALTLFLSGGLPGRLPAQAQAINHTIEQYDSIPGLCFQGGDKVVELSLDSCRIHKGEGKSSNEGDILLWGDSHARALTPAFRSLLAESGSDRDIYFLGAVDCPPLLGVAKSARAELPHPENECRSFNSSALNFVRDHPEIRHVILNARWVVNYEGRRLPTDHQSGDHVYLYDDEIDTIDVANNPAVFTRGLQRTLAALKSMGREVTVVISPPEFPLLVAPTAMRLAMTDRQVDISMPYLDAVARTSNTIKTITELTEKNGAALFNSQQVLCDKTICRGVINQLPVLYDDNHVTSFGAELLIEALWAEQKERDTAGDRRTM
ncbi:Peptidoglycan/LPS O-acetylase OafA/YrhL, contains acyltransferase and SGNH-hydrolase domains [Microbulbifer donghaiensis]|uniref:Peptidoglycan/LPS O-acetylase OafA/YrhL, contains acyltransferase and SGNH-hydrolase domains n=1 Tax=Microbulbifer donghaiensis TaxID=494016 RepID=A0A1M4U8I4_9GAMM|nr:acyltransferase family protein [Microbulbifer donghaiensis]SHE53079.1 Peptidoglycan/LPS O-acetylase OafA/YrhL, contains acyltransferase and SGNH-hydrolase domains [Microbulbifer donghaiensis]